MQAQDALPGAAELAPRATMPSEALGAHRGGTIAVASQVQQGTTFTIRLPRDKNALAFSTPIAHAASAPTS